MTFRYINDIYLNETKFRFYLDRIYIVGNDFTNSNNSSIIILFFYLIESLILFILTINRKIYF